MASNSMTVTASACAWHEKSVTLDSLCGMLLMVWYEAKRGTAGLCVDGIKRRL